jgi:hypothetical protein
VVLGEFKALALNLSLGKARRTAVSLFVVPAKFRTRHLLNRSHRLYYLSGIVSVFVCEVFR